MKILWISFVWPEPGSSAAGCRTLQLVNACRIAGHEVRLVSPCQSNEHRERLERDGISTSILEPNDPRFDEYIVEYAPDIVFFDRFMIEEQFSWRVREHCPDAVRVLDTIDLHSLRRTRQRKVESGESPFELSDKDLQSDDALREVSAIYRSDLSLIVSDAELNLLQSRYHVPSELLELCRFFYPKPRDLLDFESRKNFVVIGNFNHAPNVESFRALHRGLWKEIRSKLRLHGVDKVELHIYGAYPSKEIMNLDDPSSGFRVKGWASDAKETLSKYRVNLAPLQFGAGIKGKVSDGWSVGTPCVGTSIAAEGMTGGFEFGGMVEDDFERFSEAAAKLYSERAVWEEAQRNGVRILSKLFDEELNASKFILAIESLIKERKERRGRNFIGSMLWHHNLRSTEFFSRWIEEKNRKER